MSHSNHNKKRVRVIGPDKSIEATSFEGLIPDPETLEGLEKYCPGATKRWMDVAEAEIKHRHKSESRITHTYKLSTLLGQVFGFTCSMVIFYIGWFAIDKGYDTAGATIICGSAASVIAAFWFRSKTKS